MAATLRVTDFGALPNDGLNDVAAIERAAEATPPDGTLLFPAGEYRLERTAELAPDRHYIGEAGAVLRWAGADEDGPILRIADATGGRVEGLAFIGRGVVIAGASRDLAVVNCLFQNIAAEDALWIPNPSSNIAIIRNRFQRIGIADDGEGVWGDGPGVSAIRAADPDRMTIADNRFDTVDQAITLSWNRLAGRDVTIVRNRGERVHRVGVEASGAAAVSGLLVRDNVFRDFLRPWSGSAGLSIRLDAGRGSRIRGNSIVADAPPLPGERYGYGIEVGGDGAIVESNRVEGEWAVGIMLEKAPGALVVGNRLCRTGRATILTGRNGPTFIGGNSVAPECP